MFSRKRIDQSDGSGSAGGAVNRLANLAKGGEGVVAAIEGSDAIALRLMEMGLVPGTAVVVVGAAPSGDPIEIKVRNYRLSIRLAEAERVVMVAGEDL
jgi:ferrous iron transport protein A